MTATTADLASWRDTSARQAIVTVVSIKRDWTTVFADR
jgi:hypothetical protein